MNLSSIIQELRQLRFAYLPYQPGAQSPGDRRRFPAVGYKLGLNWEIYQPGSSYDVLYATSNADLTTLRRLPRSAGKLAFDMVDSYFDVPDWDLKAMLRGVGKWALKKHEYLEPRYRKTLEGMCERSDLIVCSTPEQREHILPFNRNTYAILDFREELGHLGPRPTRVSQQIQLFWEGIGLTAAQFEVIAPVLKELSRDYTMAVHFVTDASYKPWNFPLPVLNTRHRLEKFMGDIPFYISEWSPVSVRALAQHCDLGLIPLRLSQPLFRSKPENKLLIMWSLGLPAVVSATPAYRRTMTAYGGPNWACDSAHSWYYTLKEALESSTLRRQAGELGQTYAEQNYGVEALLSRWVRALSTLL